MSEPDRATPGQTALVTGSGRGIGAEIATVLGEEGYRVALAARTTAEIESVAGKIEADGGTARAFPADLADVESIERLVGDVGADLGPIGVLVNNAGVADEGDALVESDPDAWWRILEINLRAPMRLSRLVGKQMVTRGAGYIINVGTLAGARPAPQASAYGVSKAALARLGDTMAIELDQADAPVTVFTVSPGLVKTSMTRDVPMFESLPPEAWTAVEAIGDLLRRLLSGRYDALSGRFIHVDFDLDEMLENAETIVDDGLYVLRLPTLEGVID